MRFNYIRVSTQLQNTDRQLLNIECDREYIDKLSGKDTNRPQLQAMLDNLRNGDLIQVHSLDRLARNTADLLQLIDTILKKGASVKFFKENLSFESNKKTDPFQKLMLTLLGAVSEFERSIILERQKEGIAIAKQKGKYKGYQGKLTDEQKNELREMVQSKNHTITSIASKFGITRQSIYNYL
ncbi:MAG: recombinase family protein [Lactobacillaceae bacterium]|jgi:DNA invertase Pin-like site-specific DNA recombinase|nr:recombinase family protein [Lactobacillaceae bacterium]